MGKLRLIYFRDKMRKNLVCVLKLQFKESCFFRLQIFTPTNIVFGFNPFNKCAGVWGKRTPMKWTVYRGSEACMFTPNIQIFYTFLFGLNEMGRFHKTLPNVKSAYVTLQDFTPDLQKIYTDISAISVTLCNSGWSQKLH